ncbi:MAG: hypothetical protein PVG41_21825 [Desulfobacteraceae bacterium]|jgi:hypothetical protein
MRKLLVLAMVLALVSPAMAADNLTIKGAYEVFGIGADNLEEQQNHDGVDLEDDDKVHYFYQRFRVQPQFKAADGITANLRFDFNEGIWGQDQGYTTARSSDTAELQVDRAYVDVNKGIFRVRAGLQFVPLGQTQVFRDNQPALVFNIKTPVMIRLGWIKVSESIGVGTALSDESDENEDTDRYLIDLGYKTKTFSVNAFYATQQDGSTGDSDGDGIQDNYEDQPNVMGVRGKAQVGSLALAGEAAVFGGDNGNGTDYVGTQVNVNGQMKLSDALTVAADLFYSSGEGDADERKISYMGNPFARFDLKKGSAMGWDLLTYGRNPGELFTTSPPGGILPGDVFDPFLTGAGAMGGGVGAKFNPVQPLTLIGQFHYMVGESDDTGRAEAEFDKGYSVLACAVYQLAPKTSLHATYHIVEADFLEDVEVNTAQMYTLWMKVAF